MANYIGTLQDGNGNSLTPEFKTKTLSSGISAGSGLTLERVSVKIQGDFVYIRFGVYKTDQTAFSQGRINCATLASSIVPTNFVAKSVKSSSSITGYANRNCGLVIATSGDVYLDNFESADVKYAYVDVSYIK